MKYLASVFALTVAALTTPASADDLGQAYKNSGQCNAALSQINTTDWKSQKASNPSMTGAGNDYVGHLSCVKIGDYWYIIPHA